MGDNNTESAHNETWSSSTPIWLIIIKWILVVINCMWIFACSIALIMGKNVSKKVEDLSGSDFNIRIQATIELITAMVGLIGLIGHKLFVIVFHCLAFSLYFLIIFIMDQTEMFLFNLIWMLTTAFYIYQIRVRRSRPLFDTTTPAMTTTTNTSSATTRTSSLMTHSSHGKQ